MLKRKKPWMYAGPMLLALALAATFVACERETDFADEGLTDVDEVNYGVDTADVDQLEPVTPMRRDAIGTISDPENQPMGQGGPPPMDGAAVPPSPSDGDLNIGDTMPSPSEAPVNDTQGAAANMNSMDDRVDITLTESEIQIPDTLPAGTTTFNIANSGNELSGLEITGEGVDAMLEKPVEPGESGALTVDLKPGTYTVKTKDGMEKEITVTADGNAPAAQ